MIKLWRQLSQLSSQRLKTGGRRKGGRRVWVDCKGGKVLEKEGVQKLYRLHKSKVVIGENDEELDGPGQVGGRW